MAKCNRPMVQLHILALVFLLAAGFSSLMPTQGMAADETATETATASATVWEPISITEKSSLNFGIITSPSGTAGYTDFKLTCVDCSSGSSVQTALVEVSGGDGHTIGTDWKIGRYTIAGEPDQFVYPQVISPGACLPEIAGGGIVAIMSFAPVTQPLANNDVVVTSSLRVTGPVPAKVYTCTYTISASYTAP